MVAALTPLLSGAISKTVNLPREATVEAFKEVVIKSWQLGVKGITLYRDGSKFAQPLNLRLDAISQDVELKDLKYAQLLEFAEKTRERNRRLEKQVANPHASRRDKPIGIRSGHTHPAQVEDVKIYTTVNRSPNGEITEIYITTDREGTLIMGLLNSLSKTISVMLQYRIPPQNISKMLRGQKYEPYGFVTRHPYIKYCTSISDLISKIIDIEIGDYSRCQVKPEGALTAIPQAPAVASAISSALALPVLDSSESEEEEDEDNGEVNPQFPNLREPEYSTGIQNEPSADGTVELTGEAYVHESAREAARTGEKLYDGSTCPTCSSTRMVRNGTCKVCLDCGTRTGCS